AQCRRPHQRHPGDRVDLAQRQCRAQGAHSGRDARDLEEYDLARERLAVPARRHPGRAMTDTEKPLVLNVDDLDAQRYVKTRDLVAGGFSVIEARSGAEGLRLVEERAPLVVLLDVQLPDINGFEVCAYIKKKWPHIMVLQTSATFTTSESR